MQITNSKKEDGITLTETIVYLGLFAIIFLGIMQYFFFVAEDNKIAESRNELQKTVILLDSHISDSFESGNSIDTANSTFDSDNGVLRLLTDSGYLEYSVSDERVIFNNNGTQTNISPEHYSVTGLRFEQVLDNSNNLEGSRVTFTLQSNGPKNSTRTYRTLYLLP